MEHFLRSIPNSLETLWSKINRIPIQSDNNILRVLGICNRNNFKKYFIQMFGNKLNFYLSAHFFRIFHITIFLKVHCRSHSGQMQQLYKNIQLLLKWHFLVFGTFNGIVNDILISNINVEVPTNIRVFHSEWIWNGRRMLKLAVL